MGESSDSTRFLADVRKRREQQREAEQWRREHFDGFIRAVRLCTDIQTLRALAHRLGYKEGT